MKCIICRRVQVVRGSRTCNSHGCMQRRLKQLELHIKDEKAHRERWIRKIMKMLRDEAVDGYVEEEFGEQ